MIPFLSIVSVYSVFFISILVKITIPNIDCKECNARNFPFVSDINLNSITLNGNLVDEDDLTKRISKTILEGLSQEQKSHNKKDIMIRIIGAVSLIVIATLGTFFVNPDNVLAEKIIDLIKSMMK
ncbi:hypothetical protein YTPLAS73_15050 [Nitrosarchaeum sp.]|nr:hypothetical protein YTPLAS73_15050 [Nitrosarchaeum sp.]